MQKQSVQISNRIATLVFTLLLLFLLGFSLFFISSERNHNCTGEDCPICMILQQCENTLQQLGSALLLAAACLWVWKHILSLSKAVREIFSRSDSLVSRKVRLDR